MGSNNKQQPLTEDQASGSTGETTTENDNVCGICKELMIGNQHCVIISKCNHVFHRPCIENFLSDKSICPTCQNPCELGNLKRFDFQSVKPSNPKQTSNFRGRGRGAISKQTKTRSGKIIVEELEQSQNLLEFSNLETASSILPQWFQTPTKNSNKKSTITLPQNNPSFNKQTTTTLPQDPQDPPDEQNSIINSPLSLPRNNQNTLLHNISDSSKVTPTKQLPLTIPLNFQELYSRRVSHRPVRHNNNMSDNNENYVTASEIDRVIENSLMRILGNLNITPTNTQSSLSSSSQVPLQENTQHNSSDQRRSQSEIQQNYSLPPNNMSNSQRQTRDSYSHQGFSQPSQSRPSNITSNNFNQTFEPNVHYYNPQPQNSVFSNQSQNGQNSHIYNTARVDENFARRSDKITSIIQNWNLKFDGSTNGIRVDDFLYRLRSLTSDTFNNDFEIICRNLHILLTGKAREWYWNYHKQVQTIRWDEFCIALRYEYKDFRTNFDFMEEVRNRKMKPSESFEVFFEDVSSFLSRLDPPMPEADIIEILKRNLSPELRRELLYVPVYTIAHLRKLVQMRENLFGGDSLRRNIPPKFNPNFAARRTVAELDFSLEDDSCNASGFINPSVEAVQQTAMASKCWNCDSAGHHWEDCLQNKTVFCYGCGAKETYKPQCPKCSAKKISNSKNETRQNYFRPAP